MSKEEQAKVDATIDLLANSGLNWSVTKEKLVAEDGKPTSSFGLFRNDNKVHLATVTNRYKIYQNYELAEAIVEATHEIGIQTKRGGQLNGGQQVYLQAELPDIYIGKSDVKRWITGLGHHGGGSVGFGSTDTVVVCRNTFYRAYSQLTKFRHTESIQERVKEFVADIRKALGFYEQQVKTYQIMANTKLVDEVFARVMQSAFGVSEDMSKEDISAVKQNQIITVAKDIEEDVKIHGGTVWALFNGITRYTNHHAQREPRKIQLSPELRAERLQSYIMTGQGYETNLKAYNTITDWMMEKKLLLLEGVPS